MKIGSTDAGSLASVELDDQDLVDLARRLTAEQVACLVSSMDSERQRAAVRALGIIDMHGIADMLNMAYHRIKVLRMNRQRVKGTRCDVPGPDFLPDDLGFPWPMYLQSDIRQWARQTGRLDPSGRPMRLRPSGRPARRQEAE